MNPNESFDALAATPMGPPTTTFASRLHVFTTASSSEVSSPTTFLPPPLSSAGEGRCPTHPRGQTHEPPSAVWPSSVVVAGQLAASCAPDRRQRADSEPSSVGSAGDAAGDADADADCSTMLPALVSHSAAPSSAVMGDGGFVGWWSMNHSTSTTNHNNISTTTGSAPSAYLQYSTSSASVLASSSACVANSAATAALLRASQCHMDGESHFHTRDLVPAPSNSSPGHVSANGSFVLRPAASAGAGDFTDIGGFQLDRGSSDDDQDDALEDPNNADDEAANIEPLPIESGGTHWGGEEERSEMPTPSRDRNASFMSRDSPATKHFSAFDLDAAGPLSENTPFQTPPCADVSPQVNDFNFVAKGGKLGTPNPQEQCRHQHHQQQRRQQQPPPGAVRGLRRRPNAGSSSSAASNDLGRGRFGTVASFRCRPLDRDVAVKSVDAAAQPLSAATELAFAERAIEAADRLGRSAVWAHIAELHEAAHDAVACTAHITMELLSGGPVSAHAAFRGGPADTAAAVEAREQRLMRVAGDALRGLAALQTHLRVIHRDIKPDNVLLASDGTAKLADFGVAAVLSDDAQVALDQQGSILYMSPERLRGEAHGFNSDVWSLGVTLLQLANGGLHPFMRQDASSPAGPRSTPAPRDRFWALAEVIRHTDTAEECEAATREAVDAAVATSGMSKMFGAFVQACLAANAAERPSASEMLLHPWLHTHNPA